MNTYYVCWEVTLDAEDARDAAQKALDMQRNPHSTATVFDVCEEHGQMQRIDLYDVDDDEDEDLIPG